MFYSPYLCVDSGHKVQAHFEQRSTPFHPLHIRAASTLFNTNIGKYQMDFKLPP